MGLASALSTALTGLSASETMISVAGNNISNSTTDGFKQSQALFTTQFLQTMSLGSSPSGSGAGANGGTNPQQIGLGTQVAEITPDFSQGTIQVSSSPSDLAIQGNGFFIVQGSSSAQEYTRDGSFQLNASNQLVTSTGQTLLGYGVDSNFNVQKTTLQPLTIPLGSTAVAQATQNVTLQGDLSPTETVASTPQVIQSQALSDASIPSPSSPSSVSLVALAPPGTASTSTAPDTGAGNVAAGSYSYEITYSNAAGQESPPSAVIGPITTTGTAGVDQAIDLNNLPSIPSGFSQINIYRADSGTGGTYQLAGSTTGTSFTDTKSDAQLGSALNVSTLAPGNYSYYVTYYNSVTGEESRPTSLIGPQSVTLDGREIQLDNLPTPPAGSGFDQVRIYRNTSTNSSNYYLDATVSAGTNSYIDGASDASISSNQQVNLNGPPITAGTKLVDLVQLNGTTYQQPFANATQVSFTPTKGGDTLTTKTLTVTSTTTVQDFIDFVDQASGIQPSSADSADPIPGNPGGSVNTADSSIQFASNNGQPNAVSIGLAALTVTNSDGTTNPVNLNFNTTQQAVGTGPAATDFVAYDSLGDPINVSITTVLESTNSSGTTYRWFADSGQNQPSSGAGIAVGTGEVTFDGAGNLVNVTNDTVSVGRSQSAAAPLQFKLDFSQVSGLSQTSSTLSVAQQDGSAAGTLSSYSIGSNGVISGVFTNGVTRDLGQVQLALRQQFRPGAAGAEPVRRGQQLGPADPGRPGLAGHRHDRRRCRGTVEHRRRPEPDQPDYRFDRVPQRCPGHYDRANPARHADAVAPRLVVAPGRRQRFAAAVLRLCLRTSTADPVSAVLGGRIATRGTIAMIRLTRLGGEPFVLNAELIRYVEARPDTFITLTSGERLVVRESMEEVLRRAVDYQRSKHLFPPQPSARAASN